MLVKESERRISLQEIVTHDWITCNGVQPLDIQSYMPVVLDLNDIGMAVGKVATIELIKIRMKKTAERIRLKKSTNLGLPTVDEDEQPQPLVANFTLG